jgi:hypothetical protein
MSTALRSLAPFLDRVSEQGAISPERMGDVLRLPITGIARLANVHRNTLSRRPSSKLVQERLGEVARAVAAAAELVEGDQDRAILWFRHQPLSGFAGRTAEELVADGHVAAVLAHLAMLRDGVGA